MSLWKLSSETYSHRILLFTLFLSENEKKITMQNCHKENNTTPWTKPAGKSAVTRDHVNNWTSHRKLDQLANKFRQNKKKKKDSELIEQKQGHIPIYN